MRILTYVELFISEIYSLLQLSKNYLSAGDDEVSLPSPTVEGEITLNELQVNKHFERICSLLALDLASFPVKPHVKLYQQMYRPRKRAN